MYYNDHDPPHFHVRYGGAKAIIGIQDLKILDGTVPRRVLALVLEWVFLHRDELSENWSRARAREPLLPIQPLE